MTLAVCGDAQQRDHPDPDRDGCVEVRDIERQIAPTAENGTPVMTMSACAAPLKLM